MSQVHRGSQGALGGAVGGKRKGLFAATVAFALSTLPSASAATLPAGFTESQIATGLARPTAMAVASDGRIFVCEQGGTLRVIKGGVLLPAPFVTLTVSAIGERGLLGVAPHPNFPATPYLYVYYTATAPAVHNRVSRFTASGDVAVAGSETVVLELNNLSGAAAIHNGGAIHFGTDGKLYVASGEDATSSNSQTLSNLLGKILRINPDGSIPSDNPFFASATGVNRAIWALGLRNPFTFAVQPGTGRIFINDVGAATWEEIDEGVAGANYGWPSCEGFCDPPNSSFRDPIFAEAGGCAITGGDFYNPSTVQFPAAYEGDYFYQDYCIGRIRRLDPATLSVSGFATGLSSPVDLKMGVSTTWYEEAAARSSEFDTPGATPRASPFSLRARP
jgi:glucose/arabinose dehydrogenase